jgi:8-oxo-dGTP pyrophosphatase MutT (NUDIX family)
VSGGSLPDRHPDAVDPRTGPLADAIRHHAAVDAREERARAEILDAIGTLDRPFDRDGGSTHVTASAVVVGPRGVLLHRHRRLHRWLQPGGHLDPGEAPVDGALREAGEETGLTLSHPSAGPQLVHVDVHDAADGHVHLDIRYLLLGPDADPAPPPGESQDVAWFSWDEVEAMADDALVGALRSAHRLLSDGTAAVPGGRTEETDG